jgi:hypothetical protein
MSKAISNLAALRAAAGAAQTQAPAAVAAPLPNPEPAPASPPLPAAAVALPPALPADPAPPRLQTNLRTRATPVPRSREGLVAVTVHMRPEGRRVLKQLAAETDLSVDELGRMAFNMLLTHYQKPRLI